MSGQQINWYRKLLYKISFHTDVEQALRWAKAQGWRSGCAYCPRCQKSRLVELEPGLFTCSTCKMDTDADIYLAIPPQNMMKPGAYTRAVHQQLKTRKLVLPTEQKHFT